MTERLLDEDQSRKPGVDLSSIKCSSFAGTNFHSSTGYLGFCGSSRKKNTFLLILVQKVLLPKKYPVGDSLLLF